MERPSVYSTGIRRNSPGGRSASAASGSSVSSIAAAASPDFSRAIASASVASTFNDRIPAAATASRAADPGRDAARPRAGHGSVGQFSDARYLGPGDHKQSPSARRGLDAGLLRSGRDDRTRRVSGLSLLVRDPGRRLLGVRHSPGHLGAIGLGLGCRRDGSNGRRRFGRGPVRRRRRDSSGRWFISRRRMGRIGSTLRYSWEWRLRRRRRARNGGSWLAPSDSRRLRRGLRLSCVHNATARGRLRCMLHPSHFDPRLSYPLRPDGFRLRYSARPI